MTKIIVIGGGVIGLSSAYHLARKGVDVVLLEKGPLGDGASSRAGGIITGLLWTETGVLARRLSLQLYQELSSELEPYGYRFEQVGCLNLFDPASWPEREALLPLYDRLGVAYQVLDAAAIHRRWPDLTPAGDLIGLHDPLGGYSEPHEYLPALARRCRDLGVEIREREMVTGFLERGGRVAGVTIAGGEIGADGVICTVHAWTLQLLARLGVRLPIKSFVHQRYVTAALPAPVTFPAVNANPQGGYIRPARLGRVDARLLAGGETPDRAEHRVAGLDFQMSALTAPAGLKETLMTSLAPLVPALAAARWETEQVGLIAFSSDGEPILGSVAGIDGLYVGAAFHSGGFAYNPVAGLLLAELAVGDAPSVDVSAFSPQRFGAEETDDYLARSVTQEHAVRRRH